MEARDAPLRKRAPGEMVLRSSLGELALLVVASEFAAADCAWLQPAATVLWSPRARRACLGNPRLLAEACAAGDGAAGDTHGSAGSSGEKGVPLSC